MVFSPSLLLQREPSGEASRRADENPGREGPNYRFFSETRLLAEKPETALLRTGLFPVWFV
jgi:hypothetical protein